MDDGPERKLADEESGSSLLSKRRYRPMRLQASLAIGIVCIAPLLIMTWINYHQYEEAFHTESLRPISRITSNAKHSLEFFLSERLSALTLVTREKTFDELSNRDVLTRLLKNMKRAFGGFVDLGLIDFAGRQVSYAGPFKLEGKNYAEHDWFLEVQERGVYVSEVFLGYRKLPHFVIAVRHDTLEDDSYVLRATIETDMINKQILSLETPPSHDAFIVNREGVLQTPSRRFGDVLETCPLPIPPFTSNVGILETEKVDGEPVIVGYAYVDRSPFLLMHISPPGARQESWLSLRRELIALLSVSVLLIIAVVVWGTRYMTNRIRLADIKRAGILHKMEYTNRMAVIGRLAAGVAHEINNPLAIINEKAGLLNDLLSMSAEMPPKEKLKSQVDSILKSVARCGTITRRLLGFAKHMDVQPDKIVVRNLIDEVLGFLEKEAQYRGIKVEINIPDEFPTIESDRGQLQQVFLNIINNAFAAMEDGGKIDITAKALPGDKIAVSIADNGTGISEENLQHIFEPFFTTKEAHGTGLGLSITYGIVEKLGGELQVESQVGEGACFTVVLPLVSQRSV